VPHEVSRSYERGDLQGGWKAWNSYLRKRRTPEDPDSLWAGKALPLLWAIPEGLEQRDTLGLIRQLGKLARRKSKKGQEVAEHIVPWLRESSATPWDAGYALECLAWSYALIRLAPQSPGPHWWELVEHLIATATESAGLDPTEHPLVFSLLAGELPLTLAFQFPELKSCHNLAPMARRNLSRALVGLLDGEGMPHARNLRVMRPLMACWTRCCAMGQRLPAGAWDDDAEGQYRWLATQAMRMMRGDGTQVLARTERATWQNELITTAVKLGGDEADAEIATCVLPKLDKGTTHYEWPAASYNSEWARISVLQNKWSRKSKKLTVAYDDQEPRIDLYAASDRLLCGQWSFEIVRDGRLVEPPVGVEWEQVAWESDEQVDYMELELDLSGGLRLQRSFLLARHEKFAMVADAVLGSPSSELSYTGRLPLAVDARVRPQDETRELTLLTKRPAARVLPLALPEWRSDTRWGSFQAEDAHLVLCQTGTGNLFAPLFIDLSRRRLRRECTWRQLTVAETRQVVPRQTAVGYRVQIGDRQWLIYRSLAAQGNRTLLGQNLTCEMHVSRFLADGNVEELLEME
jgi:hypothetical protein